MVGAAAEPQPRAASTTGEDTRDVQAAHVPTSGTQRRFLPRQPPPRKGGLTEEVHLPAGPEVGAACEPWSAVTDLLGVDFAANVAASAPFARTLRRFRTRQPPPRKDGFAELVSLPAGFTAGATAADVRQLVRVSGHFPCVT